MVYPNTKNIETIKTNKAIKAIKTNSLPLGKPRIYEILDKIPSILMIGFFAISSFISLGVTILLIYTAYTLYIQPV